MNDSAAAFAHRLAHLGGGGEVLRHAVCRAFPHEPDAAVQLLADLTVLARDGDVSARRVLSSLMQAFGQELASRSSELQERARARGLSIVESLLTDGSAMQEQDPDAAARADAKLFTESLGHLKTKARVTRDADELARLATASEPSVLRNVLLNPRVTEALVVRIAARRPTRPEALLEVWRSAKWNRSHAVRRALAFNPYLPADVASKVLPLLMPADWREVARDGGLHPAVRDEARALLQASSRRASTTSEPDRREGADGETSTNPSPRDALRSE